MADFWPTIGCHKVVVTQSPSFVQRTIEHNKGGSPAPHMPPIPVPCHISLLPLTSPRIFERKGQEEWKNEHVRRNFSIPRHSRQQEVYKSADHAEITTFGRLQHVKHTSNTAQRSFVKHVKHIFDEFLVRFWHNPAKGTIDRSVKLLTTQLVPFWSLHPIKAQSFGFEAFQGLRSCIRSAEVSGKPEYTRWTSI